uniref:lipase 3-like n=1 Tax=Vespula vulgaris TaxID=7454 RepID=UPI00223B6F90|nr:lipase 3-like [Vespula vulgaris]
MKIIFLHFLFIHIFVNSTAFRKNNILQNFNMFNKILSNDRYATNGKYNPDIDLNTGHIIRRYGYPSEAHYISTEDGYFLTLHRIPGKSKSSPVLLQHGLFCSSAHWVFTGPKNSLAFVLADHGYDVWLGNYRGNIYSKAHKYLSTSDSKFWEFSVHEHGIYDIPAMISYITRLTKNNVTYIGHSMGSTGFYIMSILRPNIASRVQLMFSLAPVAYMNHLNSPINIITPITSNLSMMLHYFGEGEVFPLNNAVMFFSRYFCNSGAIAHKVCSIVLNMLSGFDKSQFNDTLLPVIFGHTPAGTSYKVINHYNQEIFSGKFRQYDYGSEQNLKVYNSTEPPDYDTSKISVPMVLYYAENDFLSDVTDVLKLSKELKYLVDNYKIPFKKFTHLDFLFAPQAPQLFHKRLLQTMKKFVT